MIQLYANPDGKDELIIEQFDAHTSKDPPGGEGEVGGKGGRFGDCGENGGDGEGGGAQNMHF